MIKLKSLILKKRFSKKKVLWSLAVILVFVIGFSSHFLLSTQKQFYRACSDGQGCDCLWENMSDDLRKNYIFVQEYFKKNSRLDQGILKEIPLTNLTELASFTRFCIAQEQKKEILLNLKSAPSNYACMHNTIVNQFSSDEIIFLSQVQKKSLNQLTTIPEMEAYIKVVGKLALCMNAQNQQAFIRERAILLKKIDMLKNQQKPYKK